MFGCALAQSVGSALHPIYSRCYLGRRCKIKTSNQFVFRKFCAFSILVAISNSKIVGKELYEKGGMTAERFLKFLEKNIFPYYKGHLIVLDNCIFYRYFCVWKRFVDSTIFNIFLKST